MQSRQAGTFQTCFILFELAVRPGATWDLPLRGVAVAEGADRERAHEGEPVDELMEPLRHLLRVGTRRHGRVLEGDHLREGVEPLRAHGRDRGAPLLVPAERHARAEDDG